MESSDNNYKGYKFVNLKSSPSFLFNNLTSSEQFHAYASNATPRIHIFDKHLIERGETGTCLIIDTDVPEVSALKMVQCNGIYYLVVCGEKKC